MQLLAEKLVALGLVTERQVNKQERRQMQGRNRFTSVGDFLKDVKKRLKESPDDKT